jgi:protein-disulfide isomerase
MTEETTKNETKNEAKSETITIKKDALWKYSTFVLLAIVVIGGFIAFSGNDGNPTAAVVGANPSAPSPAPTPSAAVVNLDNLEHVKGDANAKVTLVEWTDYQCPFCQRHNSQTYDQIVKEYVDTGKIKYATEDFPLGFHENAQKAAEASECAAKVGGEEAFWGMHDLLFDSGVDGGVPAFKQYASKLGLGQGDFDSCLDSGETAAAVQADLREGQAAGVQGTPGFAIVAKDGTVYPISGAQPFSAFDTALKAAGA